MSKTQKELAFLRDLYLENDWTLRFAELFDKNYKFVKNEKILYLNAGTGTHALNLREKLKDDKEIFAFFETKETLKIAQAKADIIKADVKFSDAVPKTKFDTVVADASLIEPADFQDFFTEAIRLTADRIAVFLPTKGSFGEIFSVLWEALFELDLSDKGAEVEKLIFALPTVEEVVEKAESLSLTVSEPITTIEIFEFKDGAEFVNSPLVADFLFPSWFGFLTAKENNQVRKKIAKLIDAEDIAPDFRFSIKATLIVGEKV